MFKFFDMISNFIDIIVSGFASMIEKIIMVFSMIASGYVAILEVIVFLPDILRFFVGALIAYCLIINILNKGG